MDPLSAARHALRRGEPILLYDADGREGETDIVVASEHATPQALHLLRTDGGGLVCTTLAPEHHTQLGLPFLADMTQAVSERHPVLRNLVADDLRYDPTKSSFGITINHRSTFTGIPDADRSLTIQELARFLRGLDGLPAERAQRDFGRAFRSPGHVILLNGHPGGLHARQGHTELSLELMRQAGLVPSSTICEMLDARTGRALSKADARAYAKAKGLVFLTGQDVVDAWQSHNPPNPQPAAMTAPAISLTSAS